MKEPWRFKLFFLKSVAELRINAYLWEHKLFHKGTNGNPIGITITMG